MVVRKSLKVRGITIQKFRGNNPQHSYGTGIVPASASQFGKSSKTGDTDCSAQKGLVSAENNYL